jgi:uncharacterized membrane protein (UPF0127 family)
MNTGGTQKMLSLLVAFSLSMLGSPQDEQVQKPPRHIAERQFQLKDLQVEKLRVGEIDEKTGKPKHELTCWVMDTEPKHAEGLMFVQDSDIKEDQGMIFVFKYPEVQRFWMMNTYIHLDIAYIGADYKIVKTYTMRAHDTTTNYTSVQPAQYVLEMKQGTIRRLGMKVGQRVEIPDKVKAKY